MPKHNLTIADPHMARVMAFSTPDPDDLICGEALTTVWLTWDQQMEHPADLSQCHQAFTESVDPEVIRSRGPRDIYLDVATNTLHAVF